MNSTARKKARAKLIAAANSVLDGNIKCIAAHHRWGVKERLEWASNYEAWAAQLRLSAAVLEGRKIKPAARPQARVDALYLRQARN